MDYFKQQSKRLNFRKLNENDIPAWVEFFVDNESLVYLGIDLNKSKESLAKQWIEMQLKRYKNSGLGHLAVELKENGEFIGMGGILPRELEGKNEYEIAYSLLPKYWSKGYGTEIASTLQDFGFGYNISDRFISIIDKANKRSVHVAKKNEMTKWLSTEYLGMKVDVFQIKKSEYLP